MFSEKATISYEDWNILEHLGNGASARVYKVERDGEFAALKIFEPTIFKEDKEAQERLTRQISLAEHTIPNLIKIYAIGHALVDGSEAPCILMELAPGKSLDHRELQASLTPPEVRCIIARTSHAAKELLGRGIVHRDIKPANIMFDRDSGTVTLLDTGVIRPLEGSNDVSGFAFVGTRRYSPPEFLYRLHDDTLETWTSITFYQLGATAYELLAKCRPYDHIKVEAQVNEEIKHAAPDLSLLAGSAHDLRNLVTLSMRRDCKRRLVGLTWEDFQGIEVARDSPHQVTADNASLLVVEEENLSVGAEAKLSRLVANLVAKIREAILAGNAHLSFNLQGLHCAISVGIDPRNLQPQIWISALPTIEGPAILKFRTSKFEEARFYTIDHENTNELTQDIVKAAVAVL